MENEMKTVFTEACRELEEEGYFARFEEKARAFKPIRKTINCYTSPLEFNEKALLDALLRIANYESRTRNLEEAGHLGRSCKKYVFKPVDRRRAEAGARLRMLKHLVISLKDKDAKALKNFIKDYEAGNVSDQYINIVSLLRPASHRKQRFTQKTRN